jgi:succinyl-diaminopimelate desuccinylase
MSDLGLLAAELVSISSPSRAEGPLADVVERLLAAGAHLEVRRIGDNVVASTTGTNSQRVLVAGHLDTVPGRHEPGVISDGAVVGLGAADMKGTLAVMITLALELSSLPREVTWLFYAREEIARSESGLHELAAVAPELLEADVALLGEPTSTAVEAGCQGSLRLSVHLGGVAAHTARPFMGVNALRRLAPVLEAVASATPRVVELDGVTYHEQLEPVGIEGGSGANVLPDSASLVINYRFAPDRSPEEAEGWVRSVIEPHLDRDDDTITVLDVAPGALPGLTHPVLARLVALSERPVAAKVGWTDVATFAERGVPAANFGAGDPKLAHHPGERVQLDELERLSTILRKLLGEAP